MPRRKLSTTLIFITLIAGCVAFIIWSFSQAGEHQAAQTLKGLNFRWDPEDRSVWTDSQDGLQHLHAIAPSLKTLRAESLFLAGCAGLISLDGLQSAVALEDLDVFSCPALTDLRGVQSLPALRTLEIGECPSLTNLSALKDLPALAEVKLVDCTSLANIDTLKSLPALRTLVIRSAPALKNSASLDVLKSLPSLQQLRLTGVPAAAGEAWRSELKAALPACTITFN